MSQTYFTGKHLPDDSIVEATCERGHHTFTIIQQMRFEILSQMAIKAIADEYYRDSVACFSSSLERLYEFFVLASCRKSGIDKKNFEAAWKSVASQSERQLGMYIATFLLETQSVPQLLQKKQIEFRNKIIHNGKLPDREEAIAFGQAVATCAASLLSILATESFQDAVRGIVSDHVTSRAIRIGGNAATCSIYTFLNLNNLNNIKYDVENAVLEYRKRPNIFREVA